MKIRKTFVGNLPDNKIINTNSTSETDTYSCKYLNERNVIVSSEEPTTGEEVWIQRGKNLINEEYFKAKCSISGETGLETETEAIGNGCGTEYIKVKPNTYYTFSANTKVHEIRLSEYKGNAEHIQRTLEKNSASIIIKTTPETEYLRWSLNYDNATTVTIDTLKNLDLILEKYPKKIHTKNDNGVYEEFYNEDFINQIKESMKYLNGYIYSFKTIYYSANTDTVNDANKFVSGLHVIDTNVTIANRPSKKHNTLEVVLVFTGNPNGSGDNGIQIWFNGVEVVYIRLKVWGSYTGWKQISVV